MLTLRRVLVALALMLACAVEQTHGREDCSKSKFPNTCLKKYYVRDLQYSQLLPFSSLMHSPFSSYH